MSNSIFELSINELISAITHKKLSIVEVVDAYYTNIEKFESTVHAFVTLLPKETIRTRLKETENQLTDKTKLLLGIPFSLKDAYSTRGIQTTAGSSVLEGYIPPFNATVYQKLLDSGAIVLGKNTQDAWGHGSTSENTDLTIPRNPWDRKRSAGGSSGGCAAAIAARMIPFAIGEDTGGSIRNPASSCNVTGLKVTYGRVSRYGAVAYASSLDSVGPMAKSVEDVATILSVIAGHDPYDATSSSHTVANYVDELQKSIKGISIGLPKEFFQKGTDPQVLETVKKAAQKLESLGANIFEVSIPSIDIGVAAYYLLAPSETSSNLARYDGFRFGQGRDHFTKETMRRIMIGTYALSAGYYDAYYKKALKARTLIKSDYKKALETCDFLIGPVLPTPPPKLGDIISDPVALMLSDVYTLTQNIAGIPSLALPCGFSKNGLPIGMQIMGNMFDEATILRVGHTYQQVTDWHKKTPSL